MIDTSIFFKNPFSSSDVSDEELKSYSENHLKQLTEANKNGQFSTMISDTLDAFNSYCGPDNSISINNELEAGEQTRQKIFNEFIKTIKTKEKTIQYLSDEISPIIYREFFPAGFDEYTHAGLADADRLFTRVIRAADNHTKELGRKFFDHISELKQKFSSVKTSSLKNEPVPLVKEGVQSKDRSKLERQLMKNLLTFALVYINEPDEDFRFFSNSYGPKARMNSNPDSLKQHTQKRKLGV